MTIAHDSILGDKYRLIRELDKGAMGAVWLAEHVSLHSPVAIKLIAREIAETEDGLQRFFREARTAASLRNAHVVQILDYGVEQGVPYIVMELLEGEPLSERLKRLERLSPRETEHVLRHVSRALTRAHEAGIVHRDLKPSNVFIVSNEEEELIKLLDFGVAKARVDVLTASMVSNTRTGVFLGTPFYMSPEQVEGNKGLDYRADIWSLGVLAYECLLGALPFTGDSFGSLVLSICSRPLPIPSDRGSVPAGFDAWFARACARRPSERFSSAREAASELRRLTEAALGGDEHGAGPAAPMDEKAHRPSRPEAHRLPTSSLAETNGGASRAAPPGRVGARGYQLALIGGALLAMAALVFAVLPRAGEFAPKPRAAAVAATPEPVTTGIHVTGEDGPLTLFVDGARIGVLPLEPVALKPGEHRIVVSGGPRYVDHEERLVVEGGRVLRVGPIALKAQPVLSQQSGRTGAVAMPSDAARRSALATLNVDSTPSSRVLVDGKLLGVTPISGFEVEPGAHEVVFIRGVEKRARTIVIDPGKSGRVDVKF